MKRRGLPLLLVAFTVLWPAGPLSARSAFVPSDFQQSIRTPHFVIYYNVTGAGAIGPAQGQAVADCMEQAYRREISDGGMRPLRVQPEPVVAGLDASDVGGDNNSEAMAFRQWIFVNVAAGSWTTLAETCGHELFHSIQWNYLANGFSKIDDWAIEGTAPVAAYLAFADDPATVAALFGDHLSQYWRAHTQGLKTQKYGASLFWYTLASQYGGFRFFQRFLTYADQQGWESGAQIAALEGGAPDNTTFDTLFRDFILRLPTGGVPLPPGVSPPWQNDGWITFGGDPIRLSRAPALAGFNENGTAFAAFPPLCVAPWAFHGFTLNSVGAGSNLPLRVRLSGDPGLELYALVPQSDGTWRGLRAAFPAGGLVLPPLPAGQSATLLVARMGTAGNGRYAITVDSPAGASADALQPLTALSYDPPGGPQDGTPPALAPDALQALRAHQYSPDSSGSVDEAPVALAFTPGSTTYATSSGSKHLDIAPRYLYGAGGPYLGAPADIATDLGASVAVRDGTAAITYRGVTYQLSAGSTTVSGSDGSRWEVPVAPAPAGATLLIPLEFWRTLHFTVTLGRGPGNQAVWVVASPPPA